MLMPSTITALRTRFATAECQQLPARTEQFTSAVYTGHLTPNVRRISSASGECA